MKSRERYGNSAHTPITVLPSTTVDDGTSYQEVSHVFHCMQCDLQFQMDMAVTSHGGSHEIDTGIIHIRLDPRIKLEREEEAEKRC